MTTRAEQLTLRPPGLLALWFGLLASPIAWALHLTLSYPLVPVVCAAGWELLLHAITAATALVALAAGWVSWRSLQQIREDPEAVPVQARSRGRFMAVSGLLLSALFLLVILVEGLPVFLLSACD